MKRAGSLINWILEESDFNDDQDVISDIWSSSEIDTRNRIMNSAKEQLDRDLCAWWDYQQRNKENNSSFKIIPFMIWKKRFDSP